MLLITRATHTALEKWKWGQAWLIYVRAYTHKPEFPHNASRSSPLQRHCNKSEENTFHNCLYLLHNNISEVNTKNTLPSLFRSNSSVINRKNGPRVLLNSSYIPLVIQSCSYHSLHHSQSQGRTSHLLSASQHKHSVDATLRENGLRLKSPVISLSCSYHNIVQNHSHTQTSLLSAPQHKFKINATPRRHFSLGWLDSLAVTQAGWFQALSKSQVVLALMDGLQGLHDLTHLPWWASIVLSTILVRGLLTFPLAVYQQHIVAKVENLKPEMDSLIKELRHETAIAIKKFNWDQKHARMMYNRSARRMWRDLILRENCHPFKATILLWVQIPLWISLSVALRNMASMMPHQDAAAQVLFLQLSTGGFGWIPNLTELDHSLILPVAMGITNLVITEVNVLSRVREGSKLQNVATNFFRFISIAIIPIAAYVPSCVILYWVTSSVCALAQNLVLMHPGVRQTLGIPASPSQRAQPYLHLHTQLQKKLIRKKREDDT